MPLQILGQGGGKSKLPLYLIGGVAVVALLMLRGRGASSSSGPAAASGPSEEFYRTAAAARGDMERLVATNDLERYKLDLAQQNTPAGLASTFTGEQWRGLGGNVRKTILSQAERSGSIISAGPGGGIRITPTYRGIGGDLQSVQRSRTGAFSSSSSGIGAPAPSYGQPGFYGLAGDAVRAYLEEVSDACKRSDYGWSRQPAGRREIRQPAPARQGPCEHQAAPPVHHQQ